MKGVAVTLSGAEDTGAVPILHLSFRKEGRRGRKWPCCCNGSHPGIHVDAFQRERNMLAINPCASIRAHVTALLRGLRKAMA